MKIKSLYENFKDLNMRVIGVSEGKRAEIILDEIMTENFS